MATKILSGGGNLNVTASYSPQARKNKYAQEANNAQEELARRRAALDKGSSYASQYAQAINDYINRGKFTYDFNADPVYNQYKDSYTRQGKLAMKDTVGQAAALTGGYGNSYGQTAGQQVYNQYMQKLNDIVPTLREQAYEKYNQQGTDLLKRASLLGDADQSEYEKLLKAYSIASDEFGTYSNLERQYASDELAREQFEYQKQQDEIANKLAQDKFDYQKQQDALSLALSSSSGSSSGSSEGNILYTYRGTDDGKSTFTGPDGKTYTYDIGINPYTGTRNKDAANGTFSNGYQPNNVDGNKLSSTGYTYNMNGREQSIWYAKGTYYIWDGTKNNYIALTKSQLKNELGIDVSSRNKISGDY